MFSIRNPEVSTSAKLSDRGSTSDARDSELPQNFLPSGVTFVDGVGVGRWRLSASSTWKPDTLAASLRRRAAASSASWAAFTATKAYPNPNSKNNLELSKNPHNLF